jgi:hypothetical protein
VLGQDDAASGDEAVDQGGVAVDRHR